MKLALSAIASILLNVAKIRDKFLSEMADVAEAVHATFSPRKINYELLGNKDDHLHWWLIPRHADDSNPQMPIWVMPKDVIFGEDMKPSESELHEMVLKLRQTLEK